MWAGILYTGLEIPISCTVHTSLDLILSCVTVIFYAHKSPLCQNRLEEKGMFLRWWTEQILVRFLSAPAGKYWFVWVIINYLVFNVYVNGHTIHRHSKQSQKSPVFGPYEHLHFPAFYPYQIDPWVFVGATSERMKVLLWSPNLPLAVVCFFSSCYKEYFYDPPESKNLYFWKTPQFQTTGLLSNMGCC